MSTFKPLLADKADIETLRYPVLASPKYDGFRCLINHLGDPISRNMKPIPNGYVFSKLCEMNLPQFDGELLTYTGDKVDDFNTVQSKLTSRSGMPDFKFMVFDHWGSPELPYTSRNARVAAWFADHTTYKRLQHVEQSMMYCEEQLSEFEAKCIEENWEGVMVRSEDGYYKFGRSTAKEGILLKIKRFTDDEAIVLSAHELMHNANEATTNALGHTERSSHKSNMVGMDTLGKFTCQWRGKEVEFDIGTGFNQTQRNEYWRHPDKMVGKMLTFKYQGVGPNGKPRFPVFLGFRHDL